MARALSRPRPDGFDQIGALAVIVDPRVNQRAQVMRQARIPGERMGPSDHLPVARMVERLGPACHCLPHQPRECASFVERERFPQFPGCRRHCVPRAGKGRQMCLMGATALQHGLGPTGQLQAFRPPGVACREGRVGAAVGVERQVARPPRPPGDDIAGKRPNCLGEPCLLVVDITPLRDKGLVPRVETFGLREPFPKRCDLRIPFDMDLRDARFAGPLAQGLTRRPRTASRRP